jgi:dihydroflavonol-4-reductase
MTGATGFVGAHLARLLRSQAADVRAVVRPTSLTDLLTSIGVHCAHATLDDRASLVTALKGCDTLFHLAGAVNFDDDWQHLRKINVDGTRNVLEAAQRARVRRVVVTSSIVAVGSCLRPMVLDESASWNLAALQIPYVTTKRQAEELALGSRFGATEVVVVNPSCVLGPDDVGSEFGVICQRFWKGRIPFFFGGGSNFVDVRDVALGHLAAAERGQAGERYLLAGSNVSWRQFFSELARAAKRVIPYIRLPAFVGEWFAACEARFRSGKGSRPNLSPAQAKLMPRYFYVQHNKATRELGFQPRPLRVTLADAYRSWQSRSVRDRPATRTQV